MMRRLTCAAVLAATLFATLPVVVGNARASEPVFTSAQQQTKRYKIYCVNGKIEISTKEFSDMKASRGQVCLLESFDSFSEAAEAAKRHGGVGGNCACK
jgi:hypothetical protein